MGHEADWLAGRITFITDAIFVVLVCSKQFYSNYRGRQQQQLLLPLLCREPLFIRQATESET